MSAKEIHNDLLEVYTDDALPYSTIVDWARRFREGRDSIEDGAKIGRPVSAASDRVILEVSSLVEEDPHTTLTELADDVGTQRELFTPLCMIICNFGRSVLVGFHML